MPTSLFGQIPDFPSLRLVSLLGLGGYLLWLRRNFKKIRCVLALPAHAKCTFIGDLKRIKECVTFVRLSAGPIFPHVLSYVLDVLVPEHRKDGLFVAMAHHPLLPLSRPVVIVCDIDITKQILNQKSYGKYRKGGAYGTAKPLIGDGLLSTSDGPEWRLMRDMANQGLRLPTLERAVTVTAGVTGNMIKSWHREISADHTCNVDIHQWLLRLTMDVLGQVAFSYNFSSIDAHGPNDAGLYHAFQTILSTLAVREISRSNSWPNWWYSLPLPQNLKFNEAIGKLNALCRGIIHQRRQTSGETIVANDILESLLAKDDQDKPILSDQQVLDNMRTILFAGHDTTASAISWALYLLARHPEWQARVRAEVVAAGFTSIASDGGVSTRTYSQAGVDMLPDALSFKGLEELRVLSGVVQETLRLYPSAGFTREAYAPMAVRSSSGCEYEIPPDTEIVFFPNIVHHDPARFEDPTVFRPDRWLDPSSTAKATYSPFGLGSRNCLGERLALAEVRLTLALLLTEFQFKLKEGAEVPFQVFLMTMQPHGLVLDVTPL